MVSNTASAAAVMCSALWRRQAWVVTGTPVNGRYVEIAAGIVPRRGLLMTAGAFPALGSQRCRGSSRSSARARSASRTHSTRWWTEITMYLVSRRLPLRTAGTFTYGLTRVRCTPASKGARPTRCTACARCWAPTCCDARKQSQPSPRSCSCRRSSSLRGRSHLAARRGGLSGSARWT